jgi:hypothetical protein
VTQHHGDAALNQNAASAAQQRAVNKKEREKKENSACVCACMCVCECMFVCGYVINHSDATLGRNAASAAQQRAVQSKKKERERREKCWLRVSRIKRGHSTHKGTQNVYETNN